MSDQDSPKAAQPSPLQTLSVNAESIAKVSSIVGICLYGLGLLVTNTFLAKLGASDFSILKPQCLFTGIWSCVLLFLAGFPTLSFIWVMADGKRTLKKLLSAVFSCVVAAYLSTIASWVLFLIIAGPLPYTNEPFGFWKLDVGFEGWRHLLLLMNILPLAMFVSFPRLRNVSDASSSRKIWLQAYLGLVVPLVLFGACLIGYEIFEDVNTEAGGGRPHNVTFYFSTEGKELLKTIRSATGHFHDQDGELQLEGNLIYSGSDRYIFEVDFCPREEKPILTTAPEACYYHDQHPNVCLDYPLRSRPVIVDKKVIQAFFPSGQPVFPSETTCPWKDPEKYNSR